MVVAALAFTRAPFQCASKPDPDQRMEDTAPEALWELSERFEVEGEQHARIETLRQIVQRYPKSRYAERARIELKGHGGPDDAAQGDEQHGREQRAHDQPDEQQGNEH